MLAKLPSYQIEDSVTILMRKGWQVRPGGARGALLCGVACGGACCPLYVPEDQTTQTTPLTHLLTIPFALPFPAWRGRWYVLITSEWNFQPKRLLVRTAPRECCTVRLTLTLLHTSPRPRM